MALRGGSNNYDNRFAILFRPVPRYLGAEKEKHPGSCTFGRTTLWKRGWLSGMIRLYINSMNFRSDRSKSSQKQVFIEPRYITKNIAWKDKKKVLVSKASPGGDEYPHSIISTPLYADVNTVCTETYLIVDFVNNKIEGQNLISYMTTRFFRFMMSLIKNTQNISKGVFAFVPIQDYSKSWTDEELYAKYGLTKEEIAFIESMIRPMK